MSTYSVLSKLFPHSFSAKVFFIAFVGTHVPLISTVYYILGERGGFSANLGVLMVMLVATLIGTLATLLGLNAILQPLYHVRDAMEAFELRREKIDLDSRFRDEVGEIMTMTNRLISDLDQDLRRRTDAANTDPLTGLLNRRGFYQAVTPGLAGAIIYADLDHFKSINDQHGHEVGDLVLREAARILAQAIRADDVICRFGGEEFIAFLPGCEMPESKLVAERARSELEKTVKIEGIPMTASFGIAILPAGGDVQSSIKLADDAVYLAKSAGRNRVECSAELRTADKVA